MFASDKDSERFRVLGGLGFTVQGLGWAPYRVASCLSCERSHMEMYGQPGYDLNMVCCLEGKAGFSVEGA